MPDQSLKLHLYRDLSNRIAGEPDDGPMAWSAHRERLKVIQQLSADPCFAIEDWGDANDEEQTHELVEVLLKIIEEPTAQAITLGAAVYVGKVIAAQVDKILGRAVGRLFDRLCNAFKQKKTGDFWITLPDESKIRVDASAKVTVTIKDGKTISYHVDSPPPLDGKEKMDDA